MLNNLLGVLLRFREEQFAVIGDISKMFHSIETTPVDQMTHRFLLRNLNTTKEPNTYVITAVNFGDRPSAAIAIIALRKTAELSVEKYPWASKAIIFNSYMDDISESVPDKESAMKLMGEINMILDEGGFKIKEWIYSGDHNQQTLKQNKDQHAVQILTGAKLDESATEKVLGIIWDPKEDKLLCKASLNFDKKQYRSKTIRPTVAEVIPLKLMKRQILSQVNTIYDPLGLLSPFTVRAKIMLRKFWALHSKLGWGDPIHEVLRADWVKFFQELKDLDNVSFDRSIKPEKAINNPVLVIFSDGSGEAYGAAAYARWQLEGQSYSSSLITAKNQIVPIKIVDIVRLELSGAVISKRLRCFIQEELRYQFEKVYHIVDSEIVKAMISKESYGFNTFAANRISEIQSKTEVSEWYWVNGTLNIAD